MDIINRSEVDNAIARTLAQRSGVIDKSFVLMLDSVVNAVRADAARAKLEEYRKKSWTPLAVWEVEATGESDLHACTVPRRNITNQKLPPNVIDAINAFELLVYIDATWTKAPPMGFVLTLAHELRHVWQYFNAPVVFHSQTPLSWVMPPQRTPCELDAEKAAKQTLRRIYGDSGLRDYLTGELASCKPEHREVMERLAALDDTADPQLEAKTIALLEQHAPAIRKYQLEYRFVMVGIPELAEALRGLSNVQLRP